MDELRQIAASRSDRTRSEAFLDLFSLVYQHYEAALVAPPHAGEIDFNDMIRRATELVMAGKYRSYFTHIIVDEFQDMSRGRQRLLSALLDQVSDRRLFCVGDDWQSIYRFTGSDVAQMIDFAPTFGFTAECQLTEAFRFPDEILRPSSQFIQRNPRQKTKTLHTQRRLGGPAVRIVHRTSGEKDAQALERVLADLHEEAARARVQESPSATRLGQEARRFDVLILGRNRYNLSGLPSPAMLAISYPGMDFRAMTIHKSKGLEADYVVVVGVVSGKTGLPSEFADDPILELVLAGHGEYPNAEERRLFYVALTRAKRRSVLITTQANESKFIAELHDPAYVEWVTSDGVKAGIRKLCPRCNRGTIVPKSGPYGEFLACSTYPRCDYKSSFK